MEERVISDKDREAMNDLCVQHIKRKYRCIESRAIGADSNYFLIEIKIRVYVIH